MACVLFLVAQLLYTVTVYTNPNIAVLRQMLALLSSSKVLVT